jgi:hypothetical protein
MPNGTSAADAAALAVATRSLQSSNPAHHIASLTVCAKQQQLDTCQLIQLLWQISRNLVPRHIQSKEPVLVQRLNVVHGPIQRFREVSSPQLQHED